MILRNRLMNDPTLKPPVLWIKRTLALTAALLLAAVINVRPSRAQTHAVAAQKNGSSQGLWVDNQGFFAEFQGSSLNRSGTPNPKLALGFGDCCPTVSDLAFDKAGNLWLGFIASPNGGQLGKLTPDELKRGKKGKPFRVTIGGGSIQYPSSIAFDPAGDLWVAVAGMGNLVEYTPDQLLLSGSPTPSVVMQFTNNPSTQPAVIRFDSAGDLWLAYTFLPSSAGPPAIEFTAAQVAEIQVGGSPAPALTIEAGSDFEAIWAMAFDAKNNLWIAASTFDHNSNGVDGGVVEMFKVAGKSGTLSQPDVTISPSAISSINQSLDRPSGLALDDQGSLWVSNPTSSDQVAGAANSTGFIVKFTPDQLTASGSPVPPTIISPNRKGSNVKFPSPIVFGPTVK